MLRRLCVIMSAVLVTAMVGGAAAVWAAHEGDLFVGANSTNGGINWCNGTTGGNLADFSQGFGVNSGVRFAPDGRLWGCSKNYNVVGIFNGDTGGWISWTASNNAPVNVMFHGGVAYVLTENGDPESNGATVQRYDAATGAAIDPVGTNFLTVSSPLDLPMLPEDINVGPDGNLYISSWSHGAVMRYNLTTGAFIDTFAAVPGEAIGMAWGSDGNLYVSVITSTPPNQIRKFGPDGTDLGDWATGLPSNYGAFGITFGADNNMYAVDSTNKKVMKINGTTGALISANFADCTTATNTSPNFLTFKPAVPTTGRLTGTLELGGFAGTLDLAPIRIQMSPTSGGAAKMVDLKLGANPGAYSISEVKPGTYNVTFSASTWITQSYTGVGITAGVDTPISPVLPGGDNDGSATIDLNDFSIVDANFGLGH
jgi:sugar lactone lactonase YvrE